MTLFSVSACMLHWTNFTSYFIYKILFSLSLLPLVYLILSPSSSSLFPPSLPLFLSLLTFSFSFHPFLPLLSALPFSLSLSLHLSISLPSSLSHSPSLPSIPDCVVELRLLSCCCLCLGSSRLMWSTCSPS